MIRERLKLGLLLPGVVLPYSLIRRKLNGEKVRHEQVYITARKI